MKIGILHNYTLSGSGSSTYVLGLTRALVESGHSVVVISREPDYSRYGIFGRSFLHDGDAIRPSAAGGANAGAVGYTFTFQPYIGIETHPECSDGLMFSTCTDVQMDAYVSTLVSAVSEIVVREQLQVLHVQHVLPLPYVAASILPGCRVPFVVTLHGSHIEYVLKRRPPFARYAQLGLEEAAHIIVTTDDVRRRCVEFVNIPKNRFALIPVGVDTRRFTPELGVLLTTSPVDMVNEQPLVIRDLTRTRTATFVGKAIVDKGAHFLPFIQRMVDTQLDRFRLIVIGGGGLVPLLVSVARGEMSLDDFADACGDPDDTLASHRSHRGEFSLESRAPSGLAILGPQPPEVVAAILANSGSCLIPSIIDEALPMVALESLASGALPLVRPVSGFRELHARMLQEIGHGVGQALPVGGRELICEYSRSLVDSLDISDLSAVCRRLAVEEYDWSKIGSDIVALYEVALGGQV